MNWTEGRRSCVGVSGGEYLASSQDWWSKMVEDPMAESSDVALTSAIGDRLLLLSGALHFATRK